MGHLSNLRTASTRGSRGREVSGISKTSKPNKIPLRWIALFSILPDLIDKPLALLFPVLFENNSRLIGHSLLFGIALLRYLQRLSKKNATHTIPYFALWLAYCGHYLLDKMWEKNLPVFLWPFAGPMLPLDMPAMARWKFSLLDPYNLAGEIIGLSLICAVVLHLRLRRRN